MNSYHVIYWDGTATQSTYVEAKDRDAARRQVVQEVARQGLTARNFKDHEAGLRCST